MKTRVLLYDVEVTASLGYTWGKWEQNVIHFEKEWNMLCFAYKWLGEKKTHIVALPDFKGYKKDRDNDLLLVKELHKLFSEADIVVAHNGNSFDQKMTNARFAFHGLPPPAPYKQVDTKLVAKRYFRFNSNALNDLGVFLKLGKKLKTGGFDLWLGCMAGDLKAWETMKKYNKQDVILLEKVYYKLLPWADQHPNMATIEGRPDICPRCTKEEGFWAQGWRITKTGKYRRWQCKACGCFVSERKKEKGGEPRYV